MYNDLSDFLAKHSAKQDENKTLAHTNTRIGDRNQNIYGGSYIIPNEEYENFLELYYKYVFVQNKKEYLTEKQLENNGPILVDFDFRYNHDVTDKLHTTEHIKDMIIVYLEELKQFFIFDENKEFSVYIMEKSNVNRLSDGSLTKDGIHMLISIQMDHVMQAMLRERMIVKMSEIWGDLPLINSWDAVLDEGISKGVVNWQLYGSQKPGNEPYLLKQHYIIKYDNNDNEFMMDQVDIKDFNLKKELCKLSARYLDNEKFEINPKIVEEYNKKNGMKKTKKPNSKIKVRLLEEDSDDSNDGIELEEITNYEILKRAVNNMLSTLKSSEYFIKETHEYTQILPPKYYEPGSHLLNRKVAFALKHTDERLFLSWVMLRSKASDFEYASIPDLYFKWKKHFNKSSNSDKEDITRKSIMYWAKQDAFEDFLKVKKQTIDYYIEESVLTPTEFDLATILYHMFKDKYICTSYKSKTWYVFKNHRWVIDKGETLRLCISREMHAIFQEKQEQCNVEMMHNSSNASEERIEYLKKKVKTLTEILIKLKRTTDKNNIMREAMELFYDGEFVKSMDSNRYLLCFTNGVIDFKNKIFRDGYPQDYITKTTGISYTPFNKDDKNMSEISENILDFMEKIFPVEELNKYMWEHAASCLIGTNLNQTFNIYRGSGSNGKSKFTDLMTYCLGEYKGTVPITLVTEKRNSIGGTSSEIIQLKGVRYAVMQEPSKDSKINEGIMKELTGGDPIQARGLYSESETFVPQFKLVVCTNTLFEINSNDDGTWRRIRICDFLSKFKSEGETYTDTPKYVFPKDTELDDKLKKWAPVFISMLVDLAFKTEGLVTDCSIVKASSNKYRQGQDHISTFINETVEKTNNPGDKIKKGELMNQFKLWFQNTQGTAKMPKGNELNEYMDTKFGKSNTSGWVGVKIIYPDSDEIDEIEN